MFTSGNVGVIGHFKKDTVKIQNMNYEKISQKIEQTSESRCRKTY
jgi:hypothetical protein